MKVIVNGSRLQEGLRKVTGIANGKTGIAILANVKVEAKGGKLALTTTNLDMTLYAEVDCVSIEEEGVTTVPMKKLEQTVSVLPVGEIIISSGADSKMVIRGGTAKMTIGGLSADEFPKLPEASDAAEYKIKAKTLKDLIRRSSYAMSLDDTRTTLKGVLLDFSGGKLKAVSTDGKRIAVSVADVEDNNPDAKYIVPDRAVLTIVKLLDAEGDVVIRMEKTQIAISMCDGRQRIYSKLIDGVYPAYDRAIPTSHECELKIAREEMISVIGRTAIMVSPTNPFVKLKFSENLLAVEVVGDDNCDAHETLPVKYDGPDQTFVFNPQFLLDVLRSIDSDEVTIEMSKPTLPIAVKAAGEPSLGIVMPLRNS